MKTRVLLKYFVCGCSFRPNFWPVLTQIGRQISFCGFYLYLMLYIVASYHCMRFQGQLKTEIEKMAKKPIFLPHISRLFQRNCEEFVLF